MTSSDKGLQSKFDLLCRSSADGKKLPLKEILKWFKQKEAVGKETGITDNDVEAAFSELSKDQNGMEFSEFKEMLTELAREKNYDIGELTEKLACGPVGQTQGKTADPSRSPGGTVT